MLGPILFSLMTNDIKPVSPSSILVKFANDITISIPVCVEDNNIAESEVNSIMKWAEKNQMTLNLSKTWEMILKSSSPKVPPAPLAIVECKTKLKLLGVTFEANPMNWDTHINYTLSKASRAFKSGYCLKKYSICDILTTRDSKLWNKITSNTTALNDLLTPRRILPRVHTSCFKSTFVNRCLFSIIYIVSN